MTVYVDDMRARFGRLVMCHMVADDDAELHAMADRIGVARRHHQAAGTARSHYDIALAKRRLAVRHGAQEVAWRELACMCMRRQVTGALGVPGDAVDWVRRRYAGSGGG